MNWMKVCSLDELKIGSRKVFDWDGAEILLIRNGKGIFAIENLCSHEDAPLHDGCIVGNEIICALHSWRFNIESGSCATSPDFDLPVFQTRVSEDEVWIEFP